VFKKLFGSVSKTPQNAPDFSAIDSVDKAASLAQQGQLEKIHLFPVEFGGENIPQNIAYVPVGLAQVKAHFDGTVAKMLEQGNVTQYSANPEWKGRSFVPARINIRAWHPERSGEFNYTMEIW
jgi:hypothetical protein